MIIRIMNWVDSSSDRFSPSYSIIIYMALHMVTFLTITSANAHLQSTNDEYFNKYIRSQELMIVIVCSLQYPVVIMKFMQCLPGFWPVNYTVVALLLATFLFRCIPSGFHLRPGVILENDGDADKYFAANKYLLVVLCLWIATLEYNIKIDTDWPKMGFKWVHSKFQKLGISSKLRSLFTKMRDLPSSALSISIKKGIDSEVASVTSSLPSYKTQELPTYSVNPEQPTLPPLYEEGDIILAGASTQINIQDGDFSNNNRNNRESQQYETKLHEYTIFFMLFSVEYKVAV